MAVFLVHSAIESEKDTPVGREGWGGLLRISSDRDDQMGGKSQNPKNSLDQILTPKKSHSKFLRPSLEEFFFGELRCRHESSDCFEYPKNPYLNQSTQENTRQIFLPKKIPESKLLNPKESFDHPHHLRFGVTSPPWCTTQHGDHNGDSLECCRGEVLSLPLFILFFLFCPFTWTYNWGALCSQLPYVKLKCIILPLVKKTQ